MLHGLRRDILMKTFLTFNLILVEVNALLMSLMEDSRCASISHIEAIARNTTPCFLNPKQIIIIINIAI
jgi:hypothetical protein